MKILVANPAGNVTVFVLESVPGIDERRALAASIMADKGLGAEQVGFVITPMADAKGPMSGNNPGNNDGIDDGLHAGLWHLEMSGGEFCGNAARAFALYAARVQGLEGQAKISVSVSGAEGPVQVEVDLANNRAFAEMPKPLAVGTLDFELHPAKDCGKAAAFYTPAACRELPVVIFNGITHVIAPDIEPAEEVFHAIKFLVEQKFSGSPALGVMFYDTESRIMRPLVHVRSVDTLVFESSCGSGSAALGVWLSRELGDGDHRFSISQPGGIIETLVKKKEGKITGISIGGMVELGEPRMFVFP